MSGQVYYGETTTMKVDALQLAAMIQEMRNRADAMEEEHGVLVTGSEDERDEYQMIRALVARFEQACDRIDVKGRKRDADNAARLDAAIFERARR